MAEVDPVEVSFPDGEGRVEVRTRSGRMSVASPDGTRQVRTDGPLTHIRSIEVRVVDAAGYAITAEVVGNPTNSGTVEVPIHTRLVRVTRTKSGLTGTSMAQMTIEVQPESVTRQ
jgi:hypothetical protein